MYSIYVTFNNVFILMHFYCGFVFRLVPRFKITFENICSLLAMTTTFRFWIFYPSQISRGASTGHHYVLVASAQTYSS